MVQRSNAARVETPDRVGRAGFAAASHNLPIVTGVQREVREVPNGVGSRPLKMREAQVRMRSQINLRGDRAWRTQEDTDIIKADVQEPERVTFHKCQPN